MTPLQTKWLREFMLGVLSGLPWLKSTASQTSLLCWRRQNPLVINSSFVIVSQSLRHSCSPAPWGRGCVDCNERAWSQGCASARYQTSSDINPYTIVYQHGNEHLFRSNGIYLYTCKHGERRWHFTLRCYQKNAPLSYPVFWDHEAHIR